MKFLAALKIAFCISVLASLSALGQCTLPGTPSAGTIDATFDAYTTQNGPGWTGADGTYSLPLPDGTNLWMWSDSYIGTVDPTTRLRKNYLFSAHNSLTILDQTTGSWITVGYPPRTTSYFVPTSKSDWFWQGDGVLTQPTTGTYQIKIMLTEWTGVFKLVGHSVATLSWPSLSIVSITPVTGLDTSLTWGTKILPVGSYFYIYGLKDPGTNTKTPYVARTTSINNLTNASKWQFWNSIHKEVAGGRIECHRHERRGGGDPRVFRRPDELQRRNILPDGGDGPAASSLPVVGCGDNVVFVFAPGAMVEQDDGLHRAASGSEIASLAAAR